MMKKLLILTLTILLTTATVVAASAQMRMRGEYGHGQHTIVDITKQPGLDLTHEQVVRLRTLREKNLREIQPYLNQMHTRSTELKELWLTRQPDRHKIEDLQHEIMKLQAQIMKINAAYRQGSLNLLTEKQRAILKIP